jgi:hypothetical protein
MRRKEVRRKDAEKLVKKSRGLYTCRKMICRTSNKKMERLNPCLKQAEPPITRKIRRRIQFLNLGKLELDEMKAYILL